MLAGLSCNLWDILSLMVEHISASPHYMDNYRLDMAMIPLLIKMGKRGIALRPAVLESWHKRLGEEILGYEDICADEGFDPSKPQQVGYILASRGNILPFTANQRQLKTDEKTLKKLTDPLAQVVLSHRKASKLQGTYIKPSLGKKRFYTNFRQDLSTARLASHDRNVQNIPPKIREIFAPDSGTWTWLDWSQLEMRIFAHLTQDPVMVDAYATGKDIHTVTQLALWPGSDPKDDTYRGLAKKFNFSMIYFAGVYTLSEDSGLPIADCARYRAGWLRTYHVAHGWMMYQMEEGKRLGYRENMFKRKLRLPDPDIFPQSHIDKCSINYPVQATAAGVVSRGMLICDGLNYDFPIQVHDEIVIDGDVDPPESLAHIIPELYLPFNVKKGPVWI